MRFVPDHAQLWLKRSKTDNTHEGVNIILARSSDSARPVAALETLFALDRQEPNCLLFRFARTIFSRTNFLKRLKANLQDLGVKPDGFLGDSFRKGAAQHAHNSGVLNSQIQMLGRWTSDGFQVYFSINPAVLYHLNHHS
jgi:hypothetical protein